MKDGIVVVIEVLYAARHTRSQQAEQYGQTPEHHSKSYPERLPTDLLQAVGHRPLSITASGTYFLTLRHFAWMTEGRGNRDRPGRFERLTH